MAYRLGVDVGGTFTDLFLVSDESDGGAQFRVKTPSTPERSVARACSPASAGSATEAGIDVGELRNILHGTTVATNAVLESKGARVGLITTTGFKQILHLARSQTPGPLAGWIIMIKPDPPASLADTREAVERMDARGETRRAGRRGAGREIVRDLVESGVESLTVALINSYVNPAHEEQIGAIVERLYPGFPVTLSVARAARVPRVRAGADRVHELVRAAEGRDYVEQLQARARVRSARRPRSTSCARTPGLMTTREAARNPIYGVLSGPSGGVAGALFVARKAGFDDILTFDMGGTSTDVALCQNGQPTIGRETSIGHFRIKVPSVNVHTVGAGGGSIAHVPELTKALRVGPQSAGAEPGPAAYGRGGEEPTVTDANVVLGHLPPRLLGGEMALDVDAARDGGADDRRRDGARVGRGGGRGDHRDRQREHGRRAPARLGAAWPRPARLRARRLRRRRARCTRTRVAELMGSFPVIVPPAPGPPLRDRRPRRRLPRRVRPDVHPRARREAEPGEVARHPRRRSAGARDEWLEGEGIAEERAHDHLRRRHALPPAGLRDPGRDRPRTRSARTASPSSRSASTAPRAALRVPDARHGLARSSTSARSASAPCRSRSCRSATRVRRGRVRRRRRRARRRLRRRAAARRRSTTGRSSSPAPLRRPGDRDRVRLDHGRAARLRGRGGRQLQHPDHPERRRRRADGNHTHDELRIAEIPTDIDVDPVTLDIIEGALKNARFEMDAVLFRSAMSPVIREQHDEFPMITDPRGRMVVGQFGAYINEMMDDWDRGVYPGDVILTSDPFKCSASISHTNDWLVLVPIFYEDELVGWSSQFGHQMDAGGPLAGLAADGREDDLRGGHHHPAAQDRRARRGAGGRPPADPQQRPPAGDEPGRPVRDRRRLPRGREARDRALRALRQGDVPRRAAGAPRPHLRGDEVPDLGRDPGGAADVRRLRRRRRARQRPVQDAADDLAGGRPRLLRLVGHRPAGARADQLLPLRGHVQDVHRDLPDHGQRSPDPLQRRLLSAAARRHAGGQPAAAALPGGARLPHARARAAVRRARRRALQAGARS